jgi:hypothetical protein
MLRIKHGVKLGGIKPEAVIAMVIAGQIYDAFGEDCVVTSGLDGKHMPGSKHYEGLAFDTRTRTLEKSIIEHVEDSLKQALGREYDVVYEPEKVHFHIEFDPK